MLMLKNEKEGNSGRLVLLCEFKVSNLNLDKRLRGNLMIMCTASQQVKQANLKLSELQAEVKILSERPEEALLTSMETLPAMCYSCQTDREHNDGDV